MDIISAAAPFVVLIAYFLIASWFAGLVPSRVLTINKEMASFNGSRKTAFLIGAGYVATLYTVIAILYATGVLETYLVGNKFAATGANLGILVLSIAYLALISNLFSKTFRIKAAGVAWMGGIVLFLGHYLLLLATAFFISLLPQAS